MESDASPECVLMSIKLRLILNLRTRKNCKEHFAFNITTVEPQWLEHLWDHGNLFEPVRFNHGARSGSKWE